MSTIGDDAGLFLLLLLLGRGNDRARAPLPPPATPPSLPPAPATPPAAPPRATRQPWSLDEMRAFVAEMRRASVDPSIALLGIAAASDFDPGHYLANNVGLLMVRTEHLREVGFTGTLYSLPPIEQFPWIGKVLSYRIASTGGAPPASVADLAVLLNPTNPAITQILRNEATRRAAEAAKTRYYRAHQKLLDRVLEER